MQSVTSSTRIGRCQSTPRTASSSGCSGRTSFTWIRGYRSVCCSAQLLFSAAADALEWAVKESRFEHVFHYIDDFVILGPPASAECERGLRCLHQMCKNLGVLLAEDKTEGPAARLTVLGIEFDSLAMVLRLPADKLQRLQSLLAEWHTRCSGRRGELESLVGIMQHASKAVATSWPLFLAPPLRPAGTDAEVQETLQSQAKQRMPGGPRMVGLVQSALERGASVLRPVRESCPDVHFWSDASGPWGCGAVWFQVAWDLLPIASASIPSKEVSPIVVAGAIWGRQWKGAMVCDHCDNAAVVAVINSGRAKDPLLAHQLRALFYVCAFEIRWSCSWDSAEPGHVGDRQIGRPGSPTLSLGFSSDNSIRAYTSAQARYNTPNFARPLTYLRFH